MSTQPTVTEMWAARLDGPDGPRYIETGADRDHAELTADSIATHLAEVAAGRAKAPSGPEVTGVVLVTRERRVNPDGSEHLSAWLSIRDGVPVG